MKKTNVVSGEYKPHKTTEKYLDYAISKIRSVPYKPTLRWLFYQMVQEYGFEKSEYEKFKMWVIRARKRFYKDWYPGILADDTRTSYIRGWGSKTPKGWLSYMKKQKCDLLKFKSQGVYVECWFEANAMYQQFKYWTKPYFVTLVPFGGDISIPSKWSIATRLSHVKDTYKLPIVVLYFGDCDQKGRQIPLSGYKDIRAWAGFDFKFVRVGLEPHQAKEYGISENPDKPDVYQWEALSHQDAGRIIRYGLTSYIDIKKYRKVKAIEKKTTKAYQKLFDKSRREDHYV